jgi:hypothetical protein
VGNIFSRVEVRNTPTRRAGSTSIRSSTPPDRESVHIPSSVDFQRVAAVGHGTMVYFQHQRGSERCEAKQSPLSSPPQSSDRPGGRSSHPLLLVKTYFVCEFCLWCFSVFSSSFSIAFVHA